ncbi:MAG: HNH endonuclease signature motif containing protein [Lacunisphaera sp.]|nr:HNH endonuclease signature motif containing protein [Lacunisphaera sp.]
MKDITAQAVYRFAKLKAGSKLRTLTHKRPFKILVEDGQLIFVPSSGRHFKPQLPRYVAAFNRHHSFQPGKFPKDLWSRSYFVSLLDAMLREKFAEAKMKSLLQPEPPSEKLEKKVKRLRKMGPLPPPPGQKIPGRIKTTVTQIERDPAVKAWVLQNAQGECDLCGKPAPFEDFDGVPFLELHHVRFLADHGEDTIENAVALCPNCHRACHYSQNRKKLKARLYKRRPRLVKK